MGVADPDMGRHRGGAGHHPQRGIPNFFRELHENKENWVGVGGRGVTFAPPLDPPLIYHLVVIFKQLQRVVVL